MAQAPPRELPAVLSLVVQTLDVLPTPALLLDPAGDPRHLNPAAARMALRGGSGRGEGVAALFDGPMPEAMRAALDPQVFAQRAAEVLCQERVGGQLFRVSSAPLEVPHNGRFLVVVLHHGGDIGGLSQGAVQLREDAMQAVIDASGEAMLLFDSELRCVLSNGLAQEATGYFAEDLSRLSLVDLGIIKDATEAGVLMEKAASGQVAHARAILETARAERLPVRAQIALILGSSTRATGMCSFPPPRLTSSRVGAIRQSGTFGRPVPGSAQGGKASGATVGGGVQAAMSEVAVASVRTKERPLETHPRQPQRPAVPKESPGASPAAAPALPASTSLSPDAPGLSRPAEKTEPSPPPDVPELTVGSGGLNGDDFAAHQSTLELSLDDLQVEVASPPPPPPSAAQRPPSTSAGAFGGRPTPAPHTGSAGVPAASISRELLVQITASPSKVVSLSDGIEGLLGYPAAEVLGWTAEEWLHKVHQPPLAEQLAQMWGGLLGQRFAPGALPDQVMEYDLVHRDGALLPCRVTWRAAQAEDGAFEGIELVIQPR